MNNWAKSSYLYLQAKKLYRLSRTFLLNEKIILSRTACLGTDLLKLKYPKRLELINQQKVRIDLFLEWANGADKPKPAVIEPLLLRKDILPLIQQQSDLTWLVAKNSENWIIIDSFSELTDQKFVHKKEGWAFCCNYSDVSHSTSFSDQFDCQGLLQLELLESYYTLFFDLLVQRFPKKKIMFIHYPTKLDQRQVFKNRGKAILQVLTSLSEKNNRIINITVPDQKVYPHENDDFPYHYSRETYKYFLEKISCFLK